jgi:hypothetical protein
MGMMRKAYKILVGKPERKRALGRPRHIWEDIRKDLREIVLDSVDWLHLPQDGDQWRAFVNTGAMKGWEFLD